MSVFPLEWLFAIALGRNAALIQSRKVEPRHSVADHRVPDVHEPFHRKRTRASTSADRKPSPWSADREDSSRKLPLLLMQHHEDLEEYSHINKHRQKSTDITVFIMIVL